MQAADAVLTALPSATCAGSTPASASRSGGRRRKTAAGGAESGDDDDGEEGAAALYLETIDKQVMVEGFRWGAEG